MNWFKAFLVGIVLVIVVFGIIIIISLRDMPLMGSTNEQIIEWAKINIIDKLEKYKEIHRIYPEALDQICKGCNFQYSRSSDGLQYKLCKEYFFDNVGEVKCYDPENQIWEIHPTI